MDSLFFPACCFSDNPRLDSFWRELYRYRLQVAGEPTLCDAQRPGDEHYRFLTSEGFSGIVRVQRVGAVSELIAKQLRLDRAGGPDEASWSVRECRRELRPREWRRLQHLLQKTKLWGMASWDDRIGLDGFHCLIEGRTAEHYHSVDRWRPQRDAFARLCDWFVSLYDGVVERPRHGGACEADS